MVNKIVKNHSNHLIKNPYFNEIESTLERMTPITDKIMATKRAISNNLPSFVSASKIIS
jgi:hypothetical protein